MSLAWTAHELRGPILDIPPAVDHVVSALDSGREAELFICTRQELDRLSELGGALLRLAAESEAPRLQTVDLVQVVHEGRGLRSAGDRKLARRGRLVRHRLDQARTAVVNLVLNATANSGMEEPVVGSVARRRYSATIMLHDRDPGPGPSYRDRIFDPFVPRTNGPGTQSGSGLGLYLTRRIVPGHRGSVPAGTADGRSAFRVELPLGMNGRQPSAS
jgi:two-component system sensor histidine kinase MtrB